MRWTMLTLVLLAGCTNELVDLTPCDDAATDVPDAGDLTICNTSLCQVVCNALPAGPLPGGCYTVKDGCWWCACGAADGLLTVQPSPAGCPGTMP